MPNFKTKADWLEARRKYVTASDIPSLLGVGYESALEVWARKTGKIPDDSESSIRMRVGKALEPEIIMELAAAMPEHEIVRGGEFELVTHATEPFAATPDAYAFTGDFSKTTPVELKTVVQGGDKWTDSEPAIYGYLQNMWQILVTKADSGIVAALFVTEDKFRHYAIQYDPELAEHLQEVAHQFWQCVQSDTPPAPDGSDSARETLRKLYPRSVQKTILLPPNAGDIAAHLEASKANAKEANQLVSKYQSELCAMLGDAEIGILPEAKLVWSWKSQSRAGYTVAPTELRVARELKWNENYTKMLTEGVTS